MMQFRQPTILDHSDSVLRDDQRSGTLNLTSLDPAYLNPVREEALQLLNTGGARAQVAWFAVGAMVVGFGLGWVSSLSWYSPPAAVASNPVTQKDASNRRAELKSAQIENTRRPATFGTGTNNSAKPQALPTGAIPRADWENARSATAALPPDSSLPTGSIPAREPIQPAPETRPTTIEGWTVRDVRGGTAILEGPDGIRTAVAGDTVPGVGRIDSIVRWGNRWIVATASGLIATP